MALRAMVRAHRTVSDQELNEAIALGAVEGNSEPKATLTGQRGANSAPAISVRARFMDPGSSVIPQHQWSAENYERNARFVADLGADVFALLAPLPGERILDLGCGDGALTERIVAAGAEVVGADSSAELIAAARERGLDMRVLDGHALPFSAEFDAVFSNAALHWMRRPREVIAGVRRALRPGGRFIAEMGAHGNVAAVRTALHAVLTRHGIDGLARDPWFFPTPDVYRDLLAEAGFRVVVMDLIPRPTPLRTGMRAWLQTFGDPFFTGLSAATRASITDEVVSLLGPILCDEWGNWTGDYVRLRFAAQLVEE